MGIWIFIAILVLVALYIVGVYNKLVALKNRFQNAFAQIDVQLQRRYDLIPNLVESAKAYMGHERETLEKVMLARNNAISAEQAAKSDPTNGAAIRSLGKAESALSGSLANFYAVSENYPDLKANETIQRLMEELTTTENKVGFARQAFNDAVMNYNTYREQFPNNFIAPMGSFTAAELLELEDAEARKAVKVSFN